MSVSPFAVYESLLALAGEPQNDVRVGELRAEFFRRTGAFSAADPFYERRTRAFWDFALTTGGLARELSPRLPEAERRVARTFSRAHRGLFEVTPERGTRVHFEDLWSGAAFFVDAFDVATNAGIFHHEGGLADARLVASPEGVVALLSGVFFHPHDATTHIGEVLREARARGMTRDATLDALLGMELRLATLSRVKASYAYTLPKR